MDQILPLDRWIPNFKKPLIVSGPCSAETEDQVMKIAKEIEKIDLVTVFRAGIWKPRTRPGSFEGVGEKGLPWIKRVKEETRLITAVEVATPHHVEKALEHDVDILWIGARTSVNPFSVQAIADALKGHDVPVMVKNPINADLALWIGALERISNAGIKKLAAIHRGFSVGGDSMYRNEPLWKIPIELKHRYPELPVICDPSHICGNRELIPLICQKALEMDMAGLMLESHFDPDNALSDQKQQITPTFLAELLGILHFPTEFSTDRHFAVELENLRAQVDRIDHDILEALKGRMNIVEKIGNSKAKNNITALQKQRMDELMTKRVSYGESLGLSGKYIEEVYNTIHAESVKVQTEIMDNHLADKKE